MIKIKNILIHVSILLAWAWVIVGVSLALGIPSWVCSLLGGVLAWVEFNILNEKWPVF